MTEFTIIDRNTDTIEIVSDLRYSITVFKNAATDEIQEAYFEIHPIGKRYDGRAFKLLRNGVEIKFLETF